MFETAEPEIESSVVHVTRLSGVRLTVLRPSATTAFGFSERAVKFRLLNVGAIPMP